MALRDALSIDPEHLTEAGAAALASALSTAVDGARTRQEAAERIVHLLFKHLISGDNGEPACVLVRCFHTSTYARMPLHYRDAADQLLDTVPEDALEQMRCLSLLATCGVRTVWNDVLTSVAHQTIPLPSVEVVRKAPMIARLFDDLGIPIERVVAPPDAPGFLLDTPTEFRVFHIPDALGSPFIPAQGTFVEPYGVRSVVGMGGILPDGELLAVVLFTRVPIGHEVARRFAVVAAALRVAMLPYPAKSIFDSHDV